MNGRNAIIGVLLLMGLGGCESSSEPATGLDGTWVLRSVGGDPLPARVHGDGSPVVVLSDTLVFGVMHPEFAQQLLVRSIRRLGVSGGSPAPSMGLYRYQREGDEIRLLIACPPNALCIPDDREGEINGGTMTLDYVASAYGRPFRSPLVYQRVR